ELGKRAPRQDAARGNATAAVYDAYDQLRQRYYELLDHLGELAAAEVRISTLDGLAQDGARLTELQLKRAEHGDAAGLDADRAALEEEKLRISLQEETTRFAGELLACSRLVGGRCTPFGDREKAAWFLNQGSGASAPLEERPDLKSLEAQEHAGQASATL